MNRYVGSLAFAALLLSNVARAATALEGTVVDANSGARIVGATVAAPDGTSVKSDTAGTYRLQADGRIFARAPGYRAAEYDSARLAAESGATGRRG